MNIETLRAVATVLIQWGLGFIIFGGATVAIGLIILSCLDMATVKKISKFINN